jgi:hypothetical protein
MHDNKVRLSPDVLEKAQLIAAEWGLKNARAAVEAVFRRYSDEYLRAHRSSNEPVRGYPEAAVPYIPPERSLAPLGCEALDELDDLLAM